MLRLVWEEDDSAVDGKWLIGKVVGTLTSGERAMVDWMDVAIRAVVGGTIVSAFAFIGDLLKPKSFAGLFGAAPSVAIASLALTLRSHDPTYVAVEARSMVAGTIAFAVYAYGVCLLLRRGRRAVASTATFALVGWLAVALVLWEATLAHLS